MHVFIEIRKIVADENKENSASLPQVLNVADLHQFRAWRKGKNDLRIKGDITQLTVREFPIKETTSMDQGYMEVKSEQKPVLKTYLIEESYESFKYRLADKAEIKSLRRA